LKKETGEVAWKAEGGILELAYGTPAIVERGDVTDLVIGVPEELWGLNPDSGKLRWFATHRLPGNISPSLIHADGVGYIFGGYPTTGSAAIQLGGKGDVTEDAVLWSTNTSSYIPTPILHDGHLYVVNDQGFAICMDAETGDEVFRERVMESGGRRGRGKPFYASPVLIGDRLYCVSRTNGTFVIAAKPEYEKLATNLISLDESRFQGTPAVVGDQLILRSEEAVYCISEGGGD
jgi:outer membrane protein assembly factor BamB